MTLTSITIDKAYKRDIGVLAEVSIVLDNQFSIHKLLIIKGSNGIFVAYPKYETAIEDGKARHRDVAHPIQNNIRQDIQEKVLNHYYKMKNKLEEVQE